MDLALGSSKQSLVHLLQVYSNPAPGVVAPQVLIFRSASGERQQATRATLRRARQLRADEAELLVTRYLAVRNIRTVAREFQVSRTTVARILTEHGIDASRRMTDAQILTAAKLYEQGLSSAAIGKQLGFDNHTILKALRGRSIAIRPAVRQRSRRTDRSGKVTYPFSSPVSGHAGLTPSTEISCQTQRGST